MTYRARIEEISQTDSGSLVALIQEWVDGGPGIIVTGVLLTAAADSECVVAVSSLNEGECSKEDPPPPSTSDNTAGNHRRSGGYPHHCDSSCYHCNSSFEVSS